MESLERELTCSICTEILFQPLTLLDCLHTFCGACLKEWFKTKATSIANSPHGPPPPGTPLFTCPSCRAPIRDTKHNATVATLLDMFTSANPDKDRTAAEKEELLTMYKPGDKVIPEIKLRARTDREVREAEADRRMLDEVRQLSLQEVGVARSDRPPISSAGRHNQRRRTNTGSDSDTDRERDRHRRTTSHDGRQRRDSSAVRTSGDYLHPVSSHGQHARRRSTNRSTDTLPPPITTITAPSTTVSSDPRHRQVEHQRSLRSLIGTSEMSEEEMAREIEELARTIQEEGLLDGLDLDNMDADNHDALSRRIAQAYQRRQKERERERRRRREFEESSRPPRSTSAQRHSDRRDRDQSRSRRGTTPHESRRSSEDRARPPPSPWAISQSHENIASRERHNSSSTHLDIQPDHRRRRAASTGNPPSGRSATDSLTRPFTLDGRSSRSQTDLTIIAPQAIANSATIMSPRGRERSRLGDEGGSFASRLPQVVVAVPSTEQFPNSALQTPAPSGSLTVAPPISNSSSTPAPRSSHSRTVSAPLPPTQELNINCSKCDKPHIELELHYNCSICDDGNWNLCLLCYRRGAGCKHWFGFGYAAWRKWEKAMSRNPNIGRPHMLGVGRYRKKEVGRGDALGSPEQLVGSGYILESGCFCSRCHAQSNDCYWRCDYCNDGDWGFCSDCVSSGRRCDHPLLPLTYQPSLPHSLNLATIPISPALDLPPNSTLLESAVPVGSFRPLTFHPPCRICNHIIPPAAQRFHCYQCNAGNYDICTACYNSLVPAQIAPANGPAGWRRCPTGHRMVIETYTAAPSGEHRVLISEMIGGAMLKMEDTPGVPYLRWVARENGMDVPRWVSRDVAMEVPAGEQTKKQKGMGVPRDKDLGARATGVWSWFGMGEMAEDEVYFPRGATLREVEKVGEEWFFGVYMDESGLFPAGYAKITTEKKKT